MTAAPVTEVSVPVVRAMLDVAIGKGYRAGVLGIRTQPAWSGPASFGHEGRSVTVVPCVSSLAVREALRERPRDGWLVVLTDRPAEDLGASVLAHLVGHRLRTPDPWEAVRHRFAATGIDPALTAGHRDLATGLLAATSSRGTAPAPAGVLTRDHALATVAAAHLGLAARTQDGEAVLAWTAGPSVSSAVADLRALAGDAVPDAVLGWLADSVGAAREPLLALLRAGAVADAVPVGLVVGVLAATRTATTLPGTTAQGDEIAHRQQVAREALVRLEPRLGGAVPGDAVLRSWSGEAHRVVTALLAQEATRPQAERLLARADDLLDGSRALDLAGISDVLPAGLTRRFGALAAALRSTGGHGGPSGDTAAQVERAWDSVRQHRLATGDRRFAAFRAAVRLVRWWAADPVDATGVDLTAAIRRQADVDAWVDSAVNDAVPGVGDPDLGSGLAAVLDAVRVRRDAHDVAFAGALVEHTRTDPAAGSPTDGLWHLEDLLAGAVIPLARAAPVLFLVLDGMSAGVGTEIIGDVLGRPADGWVEALLPGQDRRAAALAVLPTVTEVSRASLLSGELVRGGQGVELRGFAALTAAHGLAGAALFHKKPLDSTRPGYAVSDDVGTAIDDTDGRPLVACVLNTIDDALDRSDPGGTDWGADAVRHLLPLLDRARRAGRLVVLTSDHGHVVERRNGVQRSFAAISSGRSRSPVTPAGEGEVLVEGRRVLEEGRRVVLAVDERLRYGPLKAGYHGGATPAEVVVPVVVLVSGAVPGGVDLQLAPPQEPAWWNGPLAPTEPRAATVTLAPTRAGTRPAPDLLFDVETPGRPVASAPIAGDGSLFAGVAEDVVRSRVYAAQRKTAGRVSVSDAQVRSLLTALLGAPGQRLSRTQTATALSMSTVLMRGAVLHVQRLLNVESYPVLRVDADGSTIVLDEPMLREQFEVRR